MAFFLLCWVQRKALVQTRSARRRASGQLLQNLLPVPELSQRCPGVVPETSLRYGKFRGRTTSVACVSFLKIKVFFGGSLVLVEFSFLFSSFRYGSETFGIIENFCTISSVCYSYYNTVRVLFFFAVILHCLVCVCVYMFSLLFGWEGS